MSDITTGQATVNAGAAQQVIPYVQAGRAIIIRNTGSVTVYIGGVGVTTATGYPLNVGDPPTQPLPIDNPIYGVVASGIGSIAYVEAIG